MKKFMIPLLWLSLTTSECQAIPLVFSSVIGSTDRILPSKPMVPLPVRFNTFEVLALPYFGPYIEPQVWEVPITEMPQQITWGLGSRTRTIPDFPRGEIQGILGEFEVSPFPNGRTFLYNHERLVNFRFQRAELELTYWIRMPFEETFRVKWRIYGDGTIVPEPGWFSMGLAVSGWLAVRRPRRGN